MKNWKHCALIGMVAIIVLVFGFIGCDNNPTGTDEFTVTFDLEGGNIDGVTASVKITVKSGEKIVNLPDPKKADNTFGGWFTEKNGNGSTFIEDTPISENITVFAKWTPDPDPEWQSILVEVNGDRKVTVAYLAKPGVTPVWWSNLKSALEDRANSFNAGPLTLTVAPVGIASFAVGADGKATVSEAWLTTNNDRATIRTAINSGIQTDWVN
jgi:uncharacterized repeat protein (TIGR02543 family)